MFSQARHDSLKWFQGIILRNLACSVCDISSLLRWACDCDINVVMMFVSVEDESDEYEAED